MLLQSRWCLEVGFLETFCSSWVLIAVKVEAAQIVEESDALCCRIKLQRRTLCREVGQHLRCQSRLATPSRAGQSSISVRLSIWHLRKEQTEDEIGKDVDSNLLAFWLRESSARPI